MNSVVDILLVLDRIDLLSSSNKQENLRNLNKGKEIYSIYPQDQENIVKELQKQNIFDLVEFDPIRAFIGVFGEEKENKLLDEISRRKEIYDKIVMEDNFRGLENIAESYKEEEISTKAKSYEPRLSGEEKDYKEQRGFIKGSIGQNLNNFSTESLRDELKEKEMEYPLSLGEQRYLAIEHIPHCFLVGCASDDEGITIEEFLEICRLEKIPLELNILPEIITELRNYSLISEKDNRIYTTEIANSILRDSGIIN